MKSGRNAIYIGLIAVLMLLAGSAPGGAGTAGEINAGVNATLDRIYRQISIRSDRGPTPVAVVDSRYPEDMTRPSSAVLRLVSGGVAANSRTRSSG